MRHEFFDAVLTKKETVDYVIANLKPANFIVRPIHKQFNNNLLAICYYKITIKWVNQSKISLLRLRKHADG
jgi:hypothetical protein